jgi:hypothetical protein
MQAGVDRVHMNCECVSNGLGIQASRIEQQNFCPTTKPGIRACLKDLPKLAHLGSTW